MFNFKKFFLFLFLVFCLPFVLSGPVFGEETAKTVIVTSEETFSGDYFKAAESLIFSGKVDGDAFLAGGAVTFDGEVTGDLFVGGGDVTIRGKIGQSLRVGGGQILIESEIGRNVLVLGGNIKISDGSVIAGSLVSAGGNIENSAQVGLGGNLVGGRVYNNGSFANDLLVMGGEEVIFGSSAQIGGSLTYEGPEELALKVEELTKGEVKYSPPKEKEARGFSGFAPDQFKPFFRLILLPLRVVSFLFSFLLGLLVIKFFTKGSLKVAKSLETESVRSFGLGLVFFLALPFVCLLLILTIIGIPFVFLLLTLVGMVVFVGKILGSLVVGRKLLLKLNRTGKENLALFAGLLIYSLVKFVPVVGGLYGFLLVTAGTGAVVKLIHQTYFKKSSSKK